MNTTQFENIRVGGQLLKRALRSFDRMESSKYHPDQIRRDGAGNTWPGDIEGRATLALTLLSRATGRKARHLDDMVHRFPKWMNSEGFFGPVHREEFDEQQFSSHGWVLRGLCEYYEFTKDETVLAMVRRIVDNLFLPSAGFHVRYPIEPSLRADTGLHIGAQASRTGAWTLSSDIGCDFIALDGITHAYALLGGERTRDLIDEMITRYLAIDLLALHAQTHATLTALRAIVRYCKTTGDMGLMREVEQRYRLYRTAAVTENFANYNWFERPEWTEPCAMVDSFILAFELWSHTGNEAYLEEAHRIWHSALGHGQRSNGGYGPDTCAGAGSPFIGISVDEATWCCTMRGGEGIARAIECLYTYDKGALYVPFFNDSMVRIERGGSIIALEQTTDYPYGGNVRIQVNEFRGTSFPELLLFRPEWARDCRVSRNGIMLTIQPDEHGFIPVKADIRQGDTIEYNFTMSPQKREPLNTRSLSGYHSWWYGPLMLGCLTGSEISLDRGCELEPVMPGHFQVLGTEILMRPVDEIIDMIVCKENYRRQVLFRNR